MIIIIIIIIIIITVIDSQNLAVDVYFLSVRKQIDSGLINSSTQLLLEIRLKVAAYSTSEACNK